MQKLALYILVLFACTRCAQISPLTGGKKDVDPPKVIKSEPQNASLNFNSKKIEIQFDEYIELKDLANQLIITPQMNELPEVEVNGKRLIVKFTEELLPNTTYKLSFGNAVVDLHESNILQNYEFVFSTGASIDSLGLTGKVINAFDGKPSPGILIGLYPGNSQDSIIYKNKPLYIAKTDQGGNYKFSYLPEKQFKLVGIKDDNKNLVYDGATEEIAFPNSLADPKDSTATTPLRLFKEKPAKSFIKKSVALEYGKAYIIYNTTQTDIKNIKANGLTKYVKNLAADTITLYYNNIYDSLLTVIEYETKKADTVLIKIPTSASLDRLKKNNAYKYFLEGNLTSPFPFYDQPRFVLNVPVELKNINESNIHLYELQDTLKIKKEFKLLKDIDPVTCFTVQSEYKPETSYRITFNKLVFNDESGRMNDSVTYNFKTSALEDYGQLNLKLLFPKKENYIVQLLNDKEQVVRESIVEFSLTSTSEKIMEYKNLLPGNYFVKVVEDANKNGHFDAGNYFMHYQSEIMFLNFTPIKLLSGWEIENEWKVN